jgi:hypothetical protein
MKSKNFYDIKEFIKVNTTLLFIFKTSLKTKGELWKKL